MSVPADPFVEIQAYYLSLHPLTQAEWAEYVRRFRLRSARKGEFLVEEGRVSRDVFFVRQGLAISYFQTQDDRYIRGFFTEGEFVGDYSSVLTDRPAMTTVETLESCELVVLSRESMTELYAISPTMERVGRLIAENLYLHFFERIRDFYVKSPMERYLELVQNRKDLIGRVPQHMIASYLGITPEALSRIRKKASISGQSRLNKKGKKTP